MMAAAGVAHAQESPEKDSDVAEVSDIIVTADKVGLLEKKPSSTVLGFDKPLLETSRSATLISDETISRYGIDSLDALAKISPGTFTGTYYGVAGALNIRGTLAENYFQGFKLVANNGSYNTPVAAASRIDIVRGPPSPIYGAGRVGGFLNIAPKSARDGGKYITSPTGSISATYGAYDRYQLVGELGLPLRLGDTDGGLYTYLEYDHGDQFYRGISPERFVGQMSLTLDMPGDWSYELDGMLYKSDGETQTVGWNRLTQDLIDNSTYITGQNTALTASPGAPYLTAIQTVQGGGINGAPYPALTYTNAAGFRGGGLGYQYNGTSLVTDGRFPLNSGVGTTQLSPRTVYISEADLSKTTAPTIYSGLTKTFENDDWLKLEGFFSHLSHKRFVSYGYPAWVRGGVAEARLTFRNKSSLFDDKLTIETIAGVGNRYMWGRHMQSFNSGVIALNRRDISVGATPTDSVCGPFDEGITDDSIPPNCLGWENDVHSKVNNYGAFITSDIELYDSLSLTIGGRFDNFKVNTRDTGIRSFVNPAPVRDSADKLTYTASLSYKTPFGIMPYVTYAKSAALIYNQAGDIAPNLVRNGGWILDSKLKEVGFKFQLLNGTLVGSFAYYSQTRPQLFGLPPVSVITAGKGQELEMRWLATSNLSFTFAGNLQKTRIKGPNSTIAFIPPSVLCGQTPECLISMAGGSLRTLLTLIPGREGDYTYTAIPRRVWSLYASYSTDDHDWGKAGVTWGVTYASKTSGSLPNAVVYPSYYVSNLSAFYKKDAWELSVNVNNLFDKLYFTPVADIYENQAALPSKGRIWRASVKYSF
ncbi:TonB-dependent receptor [Novosphingobium endophyticum]|uniref:TonB-dependent receptor n=2 Tax=Novosphingobium endophyticum TaxID=1955250 RepID=A0A916TW30_9SPHN|nr:TonB-dependent receptor [Novosphingobium endophyticum]